ncbi:MAG TPA: DUF5916 domain-containing protein [Candidatus Krumholzibacteria bacterium]|nr:DUF5916 domain-containing protein [Candidatus Krumholzibacteria bacterium]HRX51912.1 DUF5916 domain-containing protein [Candidatus Krumholzibacteria bacterium]
MRPLILLLLAGLSAVALPAVADDFVPVYHPQMTVGRAAGPIVLDGRLDDDGWRTAGVADNFAEHNPGDQVRPPVETRALMTYDDEALYVAWHCFDDPASVRATMTERDRIWQDDYVILCLDTFADQVWAFEIASNPYGVQGDLLWSSNYGEDMGYDLIFETAGGIVDDGWIVEMRIPWTSLRFPAAEEQVWRVDFWRNHPRSVRGQHSWAAYDRDDPCWPCKWGTVEGISGVRPGKGLELLPALTATQAGARVLASDADGDYHTDAWRNDDPTADLSLSAKYAVSSSFTLDATLNPDFSQVEADAAQIDVNTTFALSYPERRPFFQEGSDLFQTWFSTVYTRSINDPSLAFKVTGRPGRTNVAYLVARDRHTPLILPFEEGSAFIRAGESVSNILRVRHSLGDQSHLGVITTDRHLDVGGSGRVLGGDARIRLSKGWQIETQVLASHTDEPDVPGLGDDLEGTFDGGRHTAALDGEAFWGHAVYSSLEYGDRDQNLDVDYWERSPRFRADSGFEPSNDSRSVQVYYGRTLRDDDSGVLDWVQPQVNAGRKWNFAERKKDEWLWGGLSTRLKVMQIYGQLSYMVSNESFHGIQFDGIKALELNLNAVPAQWLQFGLYASTGDRIARFAERMGREERAGASVTLKPLDRLVIDTDVDLARSRDLLTDEEFFDGYILRTRVQLQVNRELATRVVLQYDDFRGSWEADPLLTYRVNPFSIFYVGSTRDYLDLTGGRGGVSGWKLTERQYFLKFQYLFQV